MMLEPWKWRIFLLCCVLISCCWVKQGLSLDADGCRLLENLCIQSKDCDREVFIEKCGKYLKRHKTKDRDDPVAIPPESMIDTWLFLRQAYGPKENRKHHESIRRVSSNPRAEHQSRYVDYEDIPRYRSPQELQSEVNENEAFYDNEALPANEARAENEVNADSQRYSDVGYDDRQAHHKDFKTRSAEQDALTSNKRNGYYAGQVHHDDASSKILSRLTRLAELKEQLDLVEERLNDKRHSDRKYLSRIRKEDFASFYDLSKSNQADHPEKKEIGTAAVTKGENVEKRDSLYIEEKKSFKKSGSESKLEDSDSPNESQIRSEVTKQNKDSSADAKSTEEEQRALNVAEDTKSADSQPSQDNDNDVASKDQKAEPVKDTGVLILRTSKSVDPNSLKTVGAKLQKVLWGIDASKQKIFSKVSVDPANNKDISLRTQVPSATYSNDFNPSVISHRINSDESLRKNISTAIGFTILGAHSRKPRNIHGPPYTLPKDKNWDEFAIIIAIVGGCTLGLIVASVIICSLKRKNHQKSPIELKNKEAITDYEELCRTKMAVNTTSPRTMKAIQADRQRHGLVDGQGKITKKSWREEPLAYNMDITTGHVILSYMEEHLKNENKLSTEWEALCNYKADQDETTVGEDSKNTSKNRYSNVLPYDHTRVKLRETANVLHSDYINASYITDVDPRNPAYIATQGPLDNTVADFWQMIWEQGVVVIVNLTRLSDMGLPQCHRYWPEEGSDVYNTYQVHLISEHIWCDDYIVRSFYLKHLLTSETRTVTQFHFLTWPDLSVPESAKPLLEFRRKVNKCYRGQACPIVVHCNNGVGRTGTYILIDMVLKKMIKGTKEIDIAATLEHLRDQRPDMVKTKAQFEFTLAAVAEEVTAILSSLSG